MNRIILGIVGSAAVASVAVVGGQQAKRDDGALIKSAMTAAPAAIAKDATIIDMMACLLWGVIKDEARSERCEG